MEDWAMPSTKAGSGVHRAPSERFKLPHSKADDRLAQRVAREAAKIRELERTLDELAKRLGQAGG
jgi:predicted trehalose synthase